MLRALSITVIQKFVLIPQFLWGKRLTTQKLQQRRKSRNDVRNLMIFKPKSYQTELKLSAEFCGYRTENYRVFEGRFKAL
jgi:hypothetical protein